MECTGLAKVVKGVKSSKTVDINYVQLLAVFEGRRLQPTTMPYEQIIYLVSQKPKENIKEYQVESENNIDSFESLAKGRWEGYCVNVKGMLCIKNL